MTRRYSWRTVLALAFAWATLAAAQDGTWSSKAPIPTARSLAASAAENGKIHVIAGWQGGNTCVYLASHDVYDAGANAWTSRASLPWTAEGVAATESGGHIYAGGGFTGCGLSTAQFAVYDPATDAWTVKAPMAMPRGRFAMGAINGVIYAAGGMTQGFSATTELASLEAYDPVANTWSARAAMPTARYNVGGAVLDGLLYVAGGLANGRALATLEAYDPSTNTWSTRASMPTPVQYPSVLAHDGLLYVAGGGGGPVVNALQVYNPALDRWSVAVPMPTARAGAVSAGVGTTLYVIAGHNDAGSTLTANEAYAITRYNLLVSVAGSGAVMSSPPGITCAPICASFFAAGTPVTLSAAPSPGAAFTGWSGACAGSASCIVAMDTQKGVTATFAPVSVVTSPLSVALAGTGSGTVASSPAGIACPGTCSASFVSGSAVTLGATPAGGSSFGGWSGAGCGGTGGCTLTLSSPTSVTATFSQASIGTSPASIDFGGESLQTTSQPRTVTFTNNSGSALTGFSLTTSTPFAATHNCASLAAGASCTASVTFTPSVIGPANGALIAQAGGITATLSLGGTGERSMVTHYYQSILGRDPDSGGKAFWESQAGALAGIGVNMNEAWYAMAMSFFNSAEYEALHRDDAGFVGDLYRTFFNRAADPGGLAFWTGQLAAGMPRDVMLVSFMLSNEFVTFSRGIFGNVNAGIEIDVVMDFYRGLLGRVPDADGFAFWLHRFRTAQCAGPQAVYDEVQAISSQFLDGPEYAGRHRTDRQFVGDLYNAFLRRGGDLGGVQFWIDALSRGTSRAALRQQFIASAEFTQRVVALATSGCQDLLEGSFTYQGVLPALGRVDYAAKSGQLLSVPQAYLGWVQLFVDPAAPAATVAAAVQANGGTILAQTPLLGLYLANAGPGHERAFLTALYANAWAKDGGAVMPPVRASLVMDYDNAAATGAGTCLDAHGSIVQGIASRRGGGFGLHDVSGMQIDALQREFYKIAAAAPAGTGQVVNMSLQIAPQSGSGFADWVTAACNLNCVKASLAQSEYLFLRGMFQEMQALWQSHPDVANRNLLTIVAGNLGVRLDTPTDYVALLQNEFPQAAARIAIVGGVDAAGSALGAGGNPYFNYAAQGLLFARGIGVQAAPPGGGVVSCNGTSFAGPEVASVLDAIWRRNPTLGGDVVLNAVRFAAGSTGTLPQDANGFATDDFITRAQRASLGFTLTVTALGTGHGSLTPSPVGPVQRAGSTVLVLEVPDASSVFTGWGGACSGILGCVVVMDDNKSVTGTFDSLIVPCTLSVSSATTSFGAGGGTGSVTVTASGTCSWGAVSNADWLAITGGGSGTSSQTVTFSVSPNLGTTTRSATITIGDKSVIVSQAPAAPPGYFSCSTRHCDSACGACTGVASTICAATSRITAPVPPGGQCDLNPYCQPGYSCISIPPGGLGFPTCQARC